MQLTASTRLWGLLLVLSTGCATVIRQAVAQDVNENTHELVGTKGAAAEEGESPRACPDDKIQHEDCRVIPCRVTCEDPQDVKH